MSSTLGRGEGEGSIVGGTTCVLCCVHWVDSCSALLSASVCHTYLLIWPRFDVGSPKDVTPEVEQWVDQYMTFSSESKAAALFHLTMRSVWGKTVMGLCGGEQ